MGIEEYFPIGVLVRPNRRAIELKGAQIPFAVPAYLVDNGAHFLRKAAEFYGIIVPFEEFCHVHKLPACEHKLTGNHLGLALAVKVDGVVPVGNANDGKTVRSAPAPDPVDNARKVFVKSRRASLKKGILCCQKPHVTGLLHIGGDRIDQIDGYVRKTARISFCACHGTVTARRVAAFVLDADKLVHGRLGKPRVDCRKGDCLLRPVPISHGAATPPCVAVIHGFPEIHDQVVLVPAVQEYIHAPVGGCAGEFVRIGFPVFL